MSEPLGRLVWEKKWAALNDALHAGRDPNAAVELCRLWNGVSG